MKVHQESEINVNFANYTNETNKPIQRIYLPYLCNTASIKGHKEITMINIYVCTESGVDRNLLVRNKFFVHLYGNRILDWGTIHHK